MCSVVLVLIHPGHSWFFKIRLLACFSETVPVNWLHKTPTLLPKKQMLCEPSLLRCWRVNVFRPARFVGGVQIKPARRGDRICAVSTDGTSWTGRGAFLIGCHSASVSGRPAITHTYKECSFGAAKLFASKSLNFGSDRNTRVGSAFSSRRSLEPRFPTDSLILGRWDLGERKPAITTFLSSMTLLFFQRSTKACTTQLAITAYYFKILCLLLLKCDFGGTGALVWMSRVHCRMCSVISVVV